MKLKKDWLYNYKVLVFGAIAIGFILGIVFSIATTFNNRDSMIFIQSLYETFYRTSITYSILYFSFCFSGIAPQFGNNKTYLSTTNLPLKNNCFLKVLNLFLLFFQYIFYLELLLIHF